MAPLVPPKPTGPLRVSVFVDCQNLYFSAKETFGRKIPDFDLKKLAQAIAGMETNRKLMHVHAYTGVHKPEVNPFWHGYWTNKLLAMRHQGILVEARPLRYSDAPVEVSPGQYMTARIGHEKGIDLRLGIDLIRGVLNGSYDVAVILSQDRDLKEAVDEVYAIRDQQQRWVQIETAFPYPNPNLGKRYAIQSTIARHIDQTTYESCIDPHDYRPKVTR